MCKVWVYSWNELCCLEMHCCVSMVQIVGSCDIKGAERLPSLNNGFSESREMNH